MNLSHLTAAQIEDAVKTLQECSVLVDAALAQAEADGDKSIRSTAAFRDAHKRMTDACLLLGVPVPSFFDEINNPHYH